ncbi:hypothetical protein CCACVL1_14444 [Corchorus capsularis]|uniref:Uncharacterized protein n=1 Tax=Corchorus capsularis TaxID=210143 RepID=A0A1R3I737_COCAP|nr:hypothetical protein CCACVL1_14444 [Corchorus capsularis]
MALPMQTKESPAQLATGIPKRVCLGNFVRARRVANTCSYTWLDVIRCMGYSNYSLDWNGDQIKGPRGGQLPSKNEGR